MLAQRRIAMKSALTVILFAVSALAQDQNAVVAAQSACGPAPVSFAVRADATQHPTPAPDPDKALVFVVEDLGQCVDCYGGRSIVGDVTAALVKVGMDGSWIGANQGSSYLFFAATPGEHHLCANWQSRLEERARSFAMVSFTAEAGKVYYFRIRLFPGQGDFAFDLDPINSDQGKYLVASSAYSVSHPKK
jgi:hypothetical protein